jgi:hypothetical protein
MLLVVPKESCVETLESFLGCVGLLLSTMELFLEAYGL